MSTSNLTLVSVLGVSAGAAYAKYGLWPVGTAGSAISSTGASGFLPTRMTPLSYITYMVVYLFGETNLGVSAVTVSGALSLLPPASIKEGVTVLRSTK